MVKYYFCSLHSEMLSQQKFNSYKYIPINSKLPIILSQRFPIKAVVESNELVLPEPQIIPVSLHELVSQPGQVGLVVRQGEGGDLQVSLLAVVLQHLLDIRMNVQSVDRDHLRPQSPEDLQPLDNPGTEVHRGEVQALAAHPEHLPPLSGGDWIVRHSVSPPFPLTQNIDKVDNG